MTGHAIVRVWPFLDGLAGCNMRFQRESRYFWWGGLPVAPLKKPGPFGGAPGAPISALLLLHDTPSVSRRRRALISTPLTLPASPKNGQTRPKGPVKNNFAFSHPIFTPSSAAPQSRILDVVSNYASGPLNRSRPNLTQIWARILGIYSCATPKSPLRSPSP